MYTERAAGVPQGFKMYSLLLGSVAYAGFSKGGGGRKFQNNEDLNENFPTQNQVLFRAQN